MKKRFLTLALALALVIALVPAATTPAAGSPDGATGRSIQLLAVGGEGLAVGAPSDPGNNGNKEPPDPNGRNDPKPDPTPPMEPDHDGGGDSIPDPGNGSPGSDPGNGGTNNGPGTNNGGNSRPDSGNNGGSNNGPGTNNGRGDSKSDPAPSQPSPSPPAPTPPAEPDHDGGSPDPGHDPAPPQPSPSPPAPTPPAEPDHDGGSPDPGHDPAPPQPSPSPPAPTPPAEPDGGTFPVAAPNLATADSWARNHINQAYNKGFIPADLQNNYKQNITRGEFVRLAMSWLRYATGLTNAELLKKHGKPEHADRSLSDTDDPDILAAARLDITAGVGGGQFGAEQQFNREQAAIMLMKICRIAGTFKEDVSDFGFTDMADLRYGMPEAVNYVGNNGVMAGKTGGRFAPGDSFQLQESIVVFNKMG